MYAKRRLNAIIHIYTLHNLWVLGLCLWINSCINLTALTYCIPRTNVRTGDTMV